MAEGLDRRGEILGAAFEEFAARGYEGATIKGIARAAGLRSPALIYHYFPDKGALFGEVLESRAPIVRAVADMEPLIDLPPEKVLPRIARAYYAFDKEEIGPVLQFMIAEALRRPEVAEKFFEAGPGRVLEFLRRYLERQVELGRLRPHDARSGARTFIGMFVLQLAGRLFFPPLAEGGPTDGEHLETAVGIFLRGLAPES